MNESREFATAYTAAVERAPKAGKIAAVAETERKVEIFPSNTVEFEEALKKVSQGLLDVLDSQFGSRPQTLVAGGIAEEGKRETSSSSSSIEDESTMQIFEEEDGE